MTVSSLLFVEDATPSCEPPNALPGSEYRRNLFHRQYFQLLDLDSLTWPEAKFLRDPTVQAWLYECVFKPDVVDFPPPERYQMRVLKALVARIEDAIVDPEEDGLSDDLMSCLSLLLASGVPPESTAAQQRSYVTYSHTLDEDMQVERTKQVTLLEWRSVLGSSGTTGLRTWEAALHLGSYLLSSHAGHNGFAATGKNVVELGAGTGYVSVLCAKHLGARHVTATDGADEVVEALASNAFINKLDERNVLEPKVLRWGSSLVGSWVEENIADHPYDLALGADVTYDEAAIPSLVSTLRDLFELRPALCVLISATIRNEKTFRVFEYACQRNHLDIVEVDFPVAPEHHQRGPFYASKVPIRIVSITHRGKSRDPFAL
ncbi:putative methyltransferase-domain-containing protein [Cryomyces antarcticus]